VRDLIVRFAGDRRYSFRAVQSPSNDRKHETSPRFPAIHLWQASVGPSSQSARHPGSYIVPILGIIIILFRRCTYHLLPAAVGFISRPSIGIVRTLGERRGVAVACLRLRVPPLITPILPSIQILASLCQTLKLSKKQSKSNRRVIVEVRCDPWDCTGNYARPAFWWLISL
jgi:hypothetical protein